MTKKHIALVLLLAVVAVSGFGFARMHEGEDAVGGCLSTFGDTLCPLDALAMVMQHTEAYLSLTNGALGFSGLILLALLAVALLSFGIFKKTFSEGPPEKTAAFVRTDTPHILIRFSEWLSLFETSPTFVRGV